jgi:hypothetical protein
MKGKGSGRVRARLSLKHYTPATGAGGAERAVAAGGRVGAGNL